mgnify:CR=1 FL=1
MAYVDLVIPSVATNPSNDWINRSAVLRNDASSADVDATQLNAVLATLDWENVLPVDAVVSGLSVGVHAFGSVINLSLQAALTHDGSTAWGSWKTITNLSTSETTYTLGASGDVWSTGGIPLSAIRNNTKFGLLIKPSSGVGVIHVQYVFIRVYYTSANSLYLNGSRSSFPRALDTIPMAANGTAPNNQIRTGDKAGTPIAPGINLLGDCLYNIEKTLIQQGDVVRGYGSPAGQALYLFTITITGTVRTFWPSINWEVGVHEDFGRVVWDSLMMSPNVLDVDDNSTVHRTWPCLPGQLLNFDFVGGFGWHRETGGTITHLNVTPKSFMAVNDGRHWGFYMGFTSSTLTANRALLRNDSYNGVRLGFWEAEPGTFTVKLLAIGGM